MEKQLELLQNHKETLECHREMLLQYFRDWLKNARKEKLSDYSSNDPSEGYYYRIR